MFVAAGTTLFSQRFPTRTYTEADGLSSSMVSDIAQDTNGLIWIATRSGISCYDGIVFHNYGAADGLQTAGFSFLTLDEKGILWTLPENGPLCISRLTDGRWESYLCNHGTTESIHFNAFAVHYSGSEPEFLCGSGRDGIYVYKSGTWKHYSTREGLSGDCVHGLAAVGNTVFVATDLGLNLIRNDSVIPCPEIIHTAIPGVVFALATEGPVPEGIPEKIWLLGENWLGVYKNGAFRIVTRAFHLNTHDIGHQCFLYHGTDSNLFFGNMYDLYCLPGDSKTIERLDQRNGLISRGATAVLVDRERNTWITGFRGITRIPSRRFIIYSTIDGLADNEIAAAMELSPGRYVFAHQGAISFLEDGKFTHLTFTTPADKQRYDTRVLDLDRDRAGNLWMAASTMGLARIDRQREIVWYGEPEGLHGKGFSVMAGADGTIYASTTDGFYRLSGGRFIRIPLKSLPDAGVRKIFAGKGQELFLATFAEGMIIWDGIREKQLKAPQNYRANNLFSVFTDSKERLWIGTLAGLFLATDTSLEKVNRDGLSIDRPVYAIVEDQQGDLWFGTDNGVIRWNGLEKTYYTISDGLSGLEINRDAVFVDHRNHIWFGTNNGLTVYQPEYEYRPAEIPPPKVALLFLEAGGDTFRSDRRVVLGYNRNDLNFCFRALSYINEQKVLYRYRLEGFDRNWSPDIFVHSTHARYTNLQPGTYRFVVQACNALNTWSEPVVSGEIRIRQPFWFQWWFIALAVTIILAVAFITARDILIRRYNLRLEKMVAIRTRELRKSEKDLQESNASKDKFFSIIAHDLKSPFNAILGMLDLLTSEYNEFTDEERQKILTSLKTTSGHTIDLLENLLTWAQAQKGLLPFHPEKFDLKEVIDETCSLLESSAQAKQITLTVPLQENMVVYADRNMIRTVMRNLLSNAIKFSFSGGTVQVRWSRESKNMVKVSVTDKGCGIPENRLNILFRLDEKSTTRGTANETGTGLGLILSRDFVIRNQGKIWVESIENTGSTFYFTLPASQVNEGDLNPPPVIHP